MRIIACLAAAVSLAACATQSIEDADEMARGELPAAPKGWVVPIETPGAVAPGWIDRIGDPWLSELVRAAQEKNQDLRIAAANVERAKALLVQAGADRLPEISISASADALGNANASGTLTRSSFAGLAVVWELDVWGRIRAGRKATLASFISAEEDLRFAQYSIAATTAQTYFAAIEAQRQANVTAETLDALEETDRIVRTRYEEGEATAEDTALSRADVEATRASLAVDLANARAARRALELILADYPQGAIRIDTDFPAVPPTPAAGAPAELLAQRPDVLSASRQVAAASNFITQAQAARLPSITINGTYGASSSLSGPGGLSNSTSFEDALWTAAGELVGPIFDAGERKAQVDIERADLEAALADYVQTALDAFEEVETSLDRNAALRAQVAALTEATEAANEAFSLALFRYQEGDTDLVDVLDIRQRVLANQANLEAARRARLDEWIALNLALGGEWD